MDVLYPRCCGLDVHLKTVVACRILPGAQGQPRKEVRTFGTVTAELLRLSDWLTQGGVTHVAMESTGVYWKPVYHLLEGSFQLLLVNAAHIKAVPGRKTDVKDSEWLADLLRHGLLSPSFVPDRSQRELRELVRYRTALVRERAAEINRVLKTLEGANIKLSSVASDVSGVSGREILAALIGGSTDPLAMAQLAKGKMRPKIPELEEALVGQFGEHQRFLVARQLAHMDALEATIAEVGAEINRRLAASPPQEPEGPGAGAAKTTPEPSAGSEVAPEAMPIEAGETALPPSGAEVVEWLVTLTGVGEVTAEKIVAEIGTQMSRFPTEGHLSSWAGMCPGQNESGGKRRSGKRRQGNRWLREALVTAAHAAGRSQGSRLGAKYRRLAARRGPKKAAVAVGRMILELAYHLIRKRTTYQEPRERVVNAGDREREQRRLVQRLEKLGCKVTLEVAQAA